MNEFVKRWLAEIAPGANDPLKLHVEADGRAYIASAEDGEIVTLCNDWDCYLDAPSIDALGELCKRDLEPNI